MLRIALAAYLSAVTLAGPWLCCCTGLRVLASLLPGLTTAAEQEAGKLPACCQHHVSSKTAVPEPGEQPPDPDCPCHKHQERVAAVPPAQATPADGLARDDAAAGGWMLVAVPVAAGWVASCGGHRDSDLQVDLPFLSAQDLLRAHHLMRC
jgi:hypothetical protein